jgi:Ca-activated chloride channel homolog
MTFLWPAMLVFLMLVPAFIAVYIGMQQRRRILVARYGNPGLAVEDTGRRVLVRRHLPPLLFLVALTILIVALARPQTVVSLPRLEGTVILAFDVSGSMAADDLKPTRLEAAKAAARSFVERQPSTVQIGVVTFSDGGFSTQAPTNEPATIAAAINRLAPQRGTSLARGIQAALNVIAAGNGEPLTLSSGRAVVVLLTDGENNLSPNPLEAAQQAADRGVRVYTVGIGSTEGAVLNIEGFSVRTRLDEETLQQIAQMTGGTYYNAASEEELQSIYDHLDPELVVKPQNMEVTSLFAGAGILVLLLGGALSLAWLGRLPSFWILDFGFKIAAI